MTVNPTFHAMLAVVSFATLFIASAQDTATYCDHVHDGLFLSGEFIEGEMTLVVPHGNPSEEWTSISTLQNPFTGCQPLPFSNGDGASSLMMTMSALESSPCIQREQMEKSTTWKTYVMTEIFPTNAKPFCVLPGNMSISTTLSCVLIEAQQELDAPLQLTYVRYEEACQHDCFYIDADIRAQAQIMPSNKKVWSTGEELSVVLILTPRVATSFRAVIHDAIFAALDPVTESDLPNASRTLVEDGVPAYGVHLGDDGESFRFRVSRWADLSTTKYNLVMKVHLLPTSPGLRRAAEEEAIEAVWTTTVELQQPAAQSVVNKQDLASSALQDNPPSAAAATEEPASCRCAASSMALLASMLLAGFAAGLLSCALPAVARRACCRPALAPAAPFPEQNFSVRASDVAGFNAPAPIVHLPDNPSGCKALEGDV